jgi:hypothetical protein
MDTVVSYHPSLFSNVTTSSSSMSRRGRGGGRSQNSPSNLLDDVADESGALAQVALGAADAGLGNASGGLLFEAKER